MEDKGTYKWLSVHLQLRVTGCLADYYILQADSKQPHLRYSSTDCFHWYFFMCGYKGMNRRKTHWTKLNQGRLDSALHASLWKTKPKQTFHSPEHCLEHLLIFRILTRNKNLKATGENNLWRWGERLLFWGTFYSRTTGAGHHHWLAESRDHGVCGPVFKSCKGVLVLREMVVQWWSSEPTSALGVFWCFYYFFFHLKYAFMIT